MISNVTPSLNALMAGDTLSLVVSSAAYPASSWVMTMNFVRFGSNIAIFDSVSAGDEFLVEATSEQTASLPPGTAQVFFIFTGIVDPTQRFSQDAGALSILPNPAVSLQPTPSQLMLLKVNKAITTILAQPEAAASFDGHSYTMHNINDLYAIAERLRLRVQNELTAIGVPTPGGTKTIRHRFV